MSLLLADVSPFLEASGPWIHSRMHGRFKKRWYVDLLACCTRLTLFVGKLLISRTISIVAKCFEYPDDLVQLNILKVDKSFPLLL
jgi:hypothetical protein